MDFILLEMLLQVVHLDPRVVPLAFVPLFAARELAEGAVLDDQRALLHVELRASLGRVHLGRVAKPASGSLVLSKQERQLGESMGESQRVE